MYQLICDDINIAVGPSAPPVIPIAPASCFVNNSIISLKADYCLVIIIAFSEYFQRRVFIILIMNKALIPLFLPERF